MRSMDVEILGAAQYCAMVVTEQAGSNPSVAANSATALVLQIVGQWRGVAGRNRSAKARV